jgi:polar amino acid transport system ATP-binding protein
MSTVRIRGLVKRMGEREVLAGVDLDVATGEVVCLLGSSGSGKTTLLRCLNQLETYDRGLIEVDGELIGRHVESSRLRALKPAEIRQQRARMGMVFQGFNLFPHMTLLENVTLAPVLLGQATRTQSEKTARGLLADVGLADRCDAYPAQLSGGQQQRAAIARALAMKPRLMLFDEPTSALDPELVGEVLAVIRKLASEGVTMLIVTHEIAFVRDIARRVAFLDQGRVIETGCALDVLNRPQQDRTRAFLARYHEGRE